MKHLSIFSALAVLSLSACGSSAPSPALVDARRAVDQARQSDAQRVAPDRVLSAQQALEAAERAHQDDAGSLRERSLAYVAQRKAELAQAYGQLKMNEKQSEQAQQAYVATQDRLRRAAENRADHTQRSLESTQNTLAQTRGTLSEQRERLDQERAARMEAEKRANAALESLRQVAQVKEESRGSVILLEGSLLFASGKSELLPVARQKLDQVAEALKQMDSDQKIVVEGYTDSRGADDANQRLSEQRAQAVRTHLVSRGVKQDLISAIGRGEQSPIADNESAEGRANNRRVEIIVQPRSNAPSSTSPQSTSGQQQTTQQSSPTQPQTAPQGRPQTQPTTTPTNTGTTTR